MDAKLNKTTALVQELKQGDMISIAGARYVVNLCHGVIDLDDNSKGYEFELSMYGIPNPPRAVLQLPENLRVVIHEWKYPKKWTGNEIR